MIFFQDEKMMRNMQESNSSEKLHLSSEIVENALCLTFSPISEMNKAVQNFFGPILIRQIIAINQGE